MTDSPPLVTPKQNGSFPDVFERTLDEGVGVEHETEQDEETHAIEPFDPTFIRIEPRQITVDLILRRFKANEIDLQSDFQRMVGIWDEVKQSRLIESMLLRIPLPAFYIDASDDDKWLVIDGLQRLNAINRFMNLRDLRLRRLEFWQEYNGKTFDALPRPLQRRLEETQLTLYVVQKGTPLKAKSNIFKRINTGGMPLSGQEIRHALNQGASTRLLEDLAKTKEFQDAVAGSVSAMRMADRECVLRFLAFKLRRPSQYSSRDELDSFLNDRMQQINRLGEETPQVLDEIMDDFRRTMKAATLIFGGRAFRKHFPDQDRRLPVSKALFEVWTVNLDKLCESQIDLLVERKDHLMEKFAELMEDTEFMSAISSSTGDSNRVHCRFNRIEQIIQEVLSV